MTPRTVITSLQAVITARKGTFPLCPAHNKVSLVRKTQRSCKLSTLCALKDNISRLVHYTSMLDRESQGSPRACAAQCPIQAPAGYAHTMVTRLWPNNISHWKARARAHKSIRRDLYWSARATESRSLRSYNAPPCAVPRLCCCGYKLIYRRDWPCSVKGARTHGNRARPSCYVTQRPASGSFRCIYADVYACERLFARREAVERILLFRRGEGGWWFFGRITGWGIDLRFLSETAKGKLLSVPFFGGVIKLRQRWTFKFSASLKVNMSIKWADYLLIVLHKKHQIPVYNHS